MSTRPDREMPLYRKVIQEMQDYLQNHCIYKRCCPHYDATRVCCKDEWNVCGTYKRKQRGLE